MDDSSIIERIRMDFAGNTANKLAERIKQMILTRELPPDYLFPREDVLCGMLGVGRSTLREAYKVLESSHFLTRTKRGTFVNNPETIIAAQPFRTNLEMSDFWDFMEFRAMIEAELASFAAQRARPEHINNMEQGLNEMKSSIGDLQKLTYHDTQFHMEVAKASGNALLLNTMHMSIEIFSQGIFNAFQIGNTEANVAEAISYHESIMFAIKQRDPVTAQNSMRSHVQSVSQRVRK